MRLYEQAPDKVSAGAYHLLEETNELMSASSANSDAKVLDAVIDALGVLLAMLFLFPLAKRRAAYLEFKASQEKRNRPSGTVWRRILQMIADGYLPRPDGPDPDAIEYAKSQASKLRVVRERVVLPVKPQPISIEGFDYKPSGLKVVIVGVPGSGKSTLGALIAATTGYTLIDLDECFPEWMSSMDDDVYATFVQAQARIISDTNLAVVYVHPLRTLPKNHTFTDVVIPQVSRGELSDAWKRRSDNDVNPEFAAAMLSRVDELFEKHIEIGKTLEAQTVRRLDRVKQTSDGR